MTEDSKEKKPLRLSGSGKLEVRKPGTSSGQVRQSFSHGRSKTVTVEVKKKRATGSFKKSINKKAPILEEKETGGLKKKNGLNKPAIKKETDSSSKARVVLKALTDDEKVARARALEDSKKASDLARKKAEEVASNKIKEEAAVEAERKAAAEREELEFNRKRSEDEARKKAAAAAARRLGDKGAQDTADDFDQDEGRKKKPGRGDLKKVISKTRGTLRRRSGKVTISEALDDTERTRSLASVRRQREREKRQAKEQVISDTRSKVYRDVLIPDSISVQELANRMSERGADVIKSLMKMGVMVTINQSIDADTAELIVEEFGHRPKRFSESDVEIGFLTGKDDKDSEKVLRPPIVTIMGHVDHGKTSLLDALRESEIASGETGGITQHIGAYQVQLPSKQQITFLDTPGHEAFTSMRARGAKVTDIVVLVVAADDGVMPQTIEAIKHAKAADTPLIVAINKIDKQGANTDKIKQDLLSHEVFIEDMGGDILSVEISALKKQGLDKLLEAIVLQSELMDLKANDSLSAEGIVIESKVERGRGSVATIIVQRGRLEVGDVVVAGKEWGKVRALLNDRGNNITRVLPGQPAEILGLTGTPLAGDDFGVVENESRAKEISSFRISELRKNEAARAASSKGSLEQMFLKKEGEDLSELCVLIKTDVHGSLEAIDGAINKLATSEVSVRLIHGAVGGINESDISLAIASNALVIGFNVRANAQAREKAKLENVEISYFSIIYDLINHVKAIMSGMLEPTIKENMLGQAKVKEVFSVSKVGKVAGCEVTDGLAKRNAKVRLLRDEVVIYESTIETLKHFKDDAKEVKSGSDCGIGIANYQDVQKGDVLEIFETEEIARSL
ncbi:MAG: translation initiation factor IF-2 [Rhodospirillaceae bacterium]|nr:translation initiation factor IF-2 [Rhodospirillaceae bacterium]